MRMLLFVCALMALTATADAEAGNEKTGSRGKRSVSCSLRYIPTPMTWVTAEKYCQALGGNLASVHNYQDYHKIQKVIREASHADGLTWIGASDAEQDGTWLWSNGKSFSYTNWCPGEPNNYKGQRQDCLQMNHGGGKCWDDLQCDARRPFVCAIED